MTAPRPAIAYCRQSVNRDDDPSQSLSIAVQERTIRDAAERAGYRITATYSDIDVSGGDTERDGLDRLYAHLDREPVDAVWVYNVSRLARDTIFTLVFARELDKRRVRLDSATESVEDRTMLGMLALMAERTRVTMSHDISRATRESARRGVWTSGRCAYGYVRNPETGKLEIDEEAAAIVRQVFSLYAAGQTVQEIRAAIAGSFTRQNNEWSEGNIRRMLQREVYRGRITLKATQGVDGRWRDGITVENTHEPIIDDVTWERVQQRRASMYRSRERTGYVRELLFFKRYRCEMCGGPMSPYARQRGGRVRMYCSRWGHSSPPFRAECPEARTYYADVVDGLVIDQLADILNRTMTLDDVLARVVRRDTGWQKREGLERNVETLEKRRERLPTALELDAIDLTRFRERDAVLAEQIQVFREQLAGLPQPPTRERIADAYQTLSDVSQVVRIASNEQLREIATIIGLTIHVDSRERPPKVRLELGEPFAQIVT